MGPQGMWALLPGSVWGRGGAGGHQVCKGGVAASGGESFPGSPQISTRFVCFLTFGFLQLKHFIFVDVNALV